MAGGDPSDVVIEPDYASRTGRSVRTIGVSFGAGFVITVITVVDEGRKWGVNTWRSSVADIRHYWPATREGVVMGAKDPIELEAEAAAAEGPARRLTRTHIPATAGSQRGSHHRRGRVDDGGRR